MKKNYCLFLLLLVATSLSVCAQTGSKFPALRAFSNKKAAGMMKVSPNADKEKGLVMYATTLSDYFNQERGWYTFRSNEPGNATKIKTWAPGTYSNVDGLRCGCWGGDAYYAFYVLQWSMGLDVPYAFVKVDVKTGDYEEIKTFEAGDDFYDNWHSYYLYCMTYNPVKDEIYALGQTTRADKTQASSLYKIDKATGAPTKLHDFDFISYGMAVDMEGTLWVQNSEYEDGDVTKNLGAKLTAFDTDNFEVKDEVKLTYDERPFTTEYYGSMSFDYTTGDLYWIASSTNTYNQQLFDVNLETGNMKSHGVFWGDFVGLYIPYTIPGNENAPAKVVDLKANPDMTGAMKSTLTWTNPSLQWNKKALEDLTEVRIYKKDSETPIGTVDATGKVGQEMSWTDENATSGINTYYVVPVNEYGEGVKDSINVYVGEDAPGPVRNITVQNNTESVTLTWDAPEIGQNEGYVNPEGLTYTIVRYPGAVEVAKDLTETKFTDTNLGQQQCFYYTIQASNSLGSGDIAESEKFIAGSAYDIPVTFNFADQLSSEAWTNLGEWAWSAGVQTGDERMITSTAQRENNWLISPDVKLEAGKTYKIRTTVKTDYGPNGATSHFKIAIGKGKNADAMTKVIREETDYSPNEYYYIETFEDFVTIDESGTYNYGIDVSSITGGDAFSLMGVSIENVNEVDMSVTGVDGLDEAVCNENNTCKVQLYNNASKTAENYKVKIARVDNDGNYVVLGETTDVPAIEPFKSAEVTVTYVPDVEDQIDVVGMVEIDGDQNASNNISEPYSILVLPEGMAPFNVTVTDENTLGEYTRTPMSFVVNESMSQSLYLADEIGMEGKIQRMAFEYKGNDITSVLGPVNVKIYMCNTDKDIYSSETDDIPLEEMQQVYEGEVTINPGTNIMSFILSDEFEYDKTKNLCIAVVKTGLVGNSYPALFSVFNNGQFDITRTIINDGSPIASWYVPVVKLAIKSDITGTVQNVNIGGNSVWYDASNSTLNFTEGNVNKVYVYDISGKMVNQFNLKGTETSLSVNLPAGLYIVRTLSVDGSVNNVKISVNK